MSHAAHFQSREVFRCFFPPTIMATEQPLPVTTLRAWPLQQVPWPPIKEETLRSPPVNISGASGSYRNWRFRKSVVRPLAR